MIIKLIGVIKTILLILFRKKLQPVIHYMDLQVRSNETESNYAKLQGEYEVMEHENHVYVNQ